MTFKLLDDPSLFFASANANLPLASRASLAPQALKDESVTHCVVVTESCVPLVSFDKLYSDLLKINEPTDEVSTPFKSYMTLSQPSKFDSESIWTKLNLNGFTSDKLITKALPGWTVLGRDDVLGVLQTEVRSD